jgi:hypothetical protein
MGRRRELGRSRNCVVRSFILNPDQLLEKILKNFDKSETETDDEGNGLELTIVS